MLQRLPPGKSVILVLLVWPGREYGRALSLNLDLSNRPYLANLYGDTARSVTTAGRRATG